MSDPSFEQAFARVRSRYPDDEWRSMGSKAIAEAIYREIRTIDAERQRRSDEEALKPTPEQQS
jgi:hypothetical protein